MRCSTRWTIYPPPPAARAASAPLDAEPASASEGQDPLLHFRAQREEPVPLALLPLRQPRPGLRRRLSPALLAGAPYRVGDRMAERYRVKDAIGIGPLGYVFRAEDEQQA